MLELPKVGGHWLFGPGRSAVEGGGQLARRFRVLGTFLEDGLGRPGHDVGDERLAVDVDGATDGRVA